jgi:hypothetical protein
MMTNQAKPKWKERVTEELRKLLVTVIYLWLLLSVFSLQREVILAHYNISYPQKLGFALLNAVILAKFMWLAEVLHAGKKATGRPLLFSMIWNSAIYAVILIVCHLLEEALVRLWHGQSLIQSLPENNWTDMLDVFATTILMFVVLIPFFATKGLFQRLGKEEIRRLLFHRLPETQQTNSVE